MQAEDNDLLTEISVCNDEENYNRKKNDNELDG